VTVIVKLVHDKFRDSENRTSDRDRLQYFDLAPVIFGERQVIIYDLRMLVCGLRDRLDELIGIAYHANVHPLVYVLHCLAMEAFMINLYIDDLKLDLAFFLPSLQYFMNGNMNAHCVNATMHYTSLPKNRKNANSDFESQCADFIFIFRIFDFDIGFSK